MLVPRYATIEWFACAICGVRQDIKWKHDVPYGTLCPNCWRFFGGDSECVAEETERAYTKTGYEKFPDAEKGVVYTTPRDSGCVVREKMRGST